MSNSIYLKFAIISFFAKQVRKMRILVYNLKGYNFRYSTIIERGVKLDKLYPKGVHIGENTLIGSGVVILTHDHCKRVANNQPYLADTYIGRNCFIALNSIILPGVKIGDEVIIGAGSVVTKDIPSNTVAAGNPARVIRTNIKMNDFAALENWSIENGWFEIDK